MKSFFCVYSNADCRLYNTALTLCLKRQHKLLVVCCICVIIAKCNSHKDSRVLSPWSSGLSGPLRPPSVHYKVYEYHCALPPNCALQFVYEYRCGLDPHYAARRSIAHAHWRLPLDFTLTRVSTVEYVYNPKIDPKRPTYHRTVRWRMQGLTEPLLLAVVILQRRKFVRCVQS